MRKTILMLVWLIGSITLAVAQNPCSPCVNQRCIPTVNEMQCPFTYCTDQTFDCGPSEVNPMPGCSFHECVTVPARGAGVICHLEKLPYPECAGCTLTSNYTFTYAGFSWTLPSFGFSSGLFDEYLAGTFPGVDITHYDGLGHEHVEHQAFDLGAFDFNNVNCTNAEFGPHKIIAYWQGGQLHFKLIKP